MDFQGKMCYALLVLKAHVEPKRWLFYPLVLVTHSIVFRQTLIGVFAFHRVTSAIFLASVYMRKRTSTESRGSAPCKQKRLLEQSKRSLPTTASWCSIS